MSFVAHLEALERQRDMLAERARFLRGKKRKDHVAEARRVAADFAEICREINRRRGEASAA